MASLNDKIKQALAERKMRGRISPNWLEGYPIRIDPKPCPHMGYVESRTIYRRVTNTTEKEKVAEFYVSDKAAYFYFELDNKQCSWHILSFDEYLREYSTIFENLKVRGIARTAFTSSEIELFDEISKIVSLKLIMELDPSPEEVGNFVAGNTALLESDHERRMQQDQDFLDSIE